MTPNDRALLLGMVYSTETSPKRGQGYRDRVRCDALANLGYDVYTMDDKHGEDEALPDRHMQANFADTSRMWRTMQRKWRNDKDRSFDLIVLDYFFSPAGWVQERWTEKFFKTTMPHFAKHNVLSQGGVLWLPHLEHVDTMIDDNSAELADYFVWDLVKDPSENPLYLATDDVNEELLSCPDNLTNATQIVPFQEMGGGPFYCFRRIDGLHIDPYGIPKLRCKQVVKDEKDEKTEQENKRRKVEGTDKEVTVVS